MGGKASAASKNKYNAKAYDRINFIVPKGEKSELQEVAKVAGESLNAYILRAVRAQMERESRESVEKSLESREAVKVAEPESR